MQTIHNLAEYIQSVCSIELESDPDILLVHPELLFRGHSSTDYEINPSLGRKPEGRWLNSLLNVEDHLVETAQQKRPDFFSDVSSPVILLAKLQHYGISTRLLDLTSNALVALYFACKPSKIKKNCDGEVIVFSTCLCSSYNRYANAIADTYRLTQNQYGPLSRFFDKVKKQSYFSDYLCTDSYNYDIKDFITKVNMPRFVEVGNICERQKNQSGYFILFPNAIGDENLRLLSYEDLSTDMDIDYTKSNILGTLVKMGKDDKSIVERIIIPNEVKSSILEQLKRFGISDEFLFADNIDITCESIMDKYKKWYR